MCGVDGLTYDNACTMDAVGILALGIGECPTLVGKNG